MYNSSASIKFVQGDSVERTFSLLDENGAAVDPELISAVYFTCCAAGLQRKLAWDSQEAAYQLSIPHSATEAMPAGEWTYDITITFYNAKRRTVTYNGRFEVLAKTNRVDYGEE